jgi:subtilisin family serine protease
MKKFILFCLIFSSSLAIVYAQDCFMYIGGEKSYLEVSPNKILVQFEEKADTNAIKSIVQRNTSFRLSEISKTDYKGLNLINFFDTDKIKIIELMKQWKNKEEILYSGVVFINKEGKEIAAITNQIIVRLKHGNDYPVLQKTIIPYDISHITRNEFDGNTCLLKINYSSEKDALQIANELYETGLFEYAEPDLLLFINYETNDIYFSNQWGLNNTGQYGGTNGIDIKATQAWNITTGSSNVKIAILDSGVDLLHSDLTSNLLPGYDTTGGGNNGNDTYGHGTACAGIAAAKGNNNIGIAGVAYDCSILPIHMGSSPLASRVADGLNWAIQNGANVVSMSFSTTETNAVNTALSQAVSSGCVPVAATGNDDNSTVSYPARNSNVIAVGAVSPCGQRKSPTSCDTETSWGSNYGTALAIVAPGVLISTTDIRGNGGFNPDTPIHPWCGGTILTSDYSNLDYTVWFNGTSAATPHVAGVAALILSVNPSLTVQQVRNIMESTAQKVRPDLYTYSTTSGHPNGTWNNEMGYGLVNAYAAVQAACAVPVNFTNQTVTTNTTITSCGDINVQNVTVTNGAKLTLNAAGEVNIISDFDVELGSEFEIIE